MKTSQLLCLLPFVAVPLLACSGGDDVYVTPDESTNQKSATSADCIVAPGEDVCANLTKYSAETPAPATIDTIRAVVDFTAVAMNSASSLMQACGSIDDDLLIPRPQGRNPSAQPGSPQWLDDLVTVYCDHAIDAIRGRAQGLTIVIAPPVCTTAPEPGAACGSGATPLRQRCDPPKVTVTPSPGAPPEQLVMAKTLERNIPAVLAIKADIERLASLTETISGNVSSLTTVQPSCTATFAQMATHSTTLMTTVSRTAAAFASVAR